MSQDEAACIEKASDTWGAASCVPRMFPRHQTSGGAQASGGDCGEVIVRVRQAAEDQVKRVGSGAQALVDKLLPAMQQSCEQDGWPPPLRTCIVATRPGDMAAMQKCTEAMPADLQEKLQERMMKAVPRPTP